jgi:hypothetical protein
MYRTTILSPALPQEPLDAGPSARWLLGVTPADLPFNNAKQTKIDLHQRKKESNTCFWYKEVEKNKKKKDSDNASQNMATYISSASERGETKRKERNHKVSLRTLTSGGGPLRGRGQRAVQASALRGCLACVCLGWW